MESYYTKKIGIACYAMIEVDTTLVASTDKEWFVMIHQSARVGKCWKPGQPNQIYRLLE